MSNHRSTNNIVCNCMSNHHSSKNIVCNCMQLIHGRRQRNKRLVPCKKTTTIQYSKSAHDERFVLNVRRYVSNYNGRRTRHTEKKGNTIKWNKQERQKTITWRCGTHSQPFPPYKISPNHRQIFQFIAIFGTERKPLFMVAIPLRKYGV